MAKHIKEVEMLPPSILKTPLSARRRSSFQVRFEKPTSVTVILQNAINGKDLKSYEELLLKIKDPQLSDQELLEFLQEVQECIPLVSEKLHHFVKAILKIQWVRRSPPVVPSFQKFLGDLVSAHNYYALSVLESLVLCFMNVKAEDDWTDCVPSEEEERWFENIHHIIQHLLQIVPMCSEMLLQTLASCFPYLKLSSHLQESYLYNLLKLVSYQPYLRRDVMMLVIKRLVALDVAIPRSESQNSEIFDIEDVSPNDKLRHTLDVLLAMLLRYLQQELPYNTKEICEILFYCFEQVVLPTHATLHVQFLIFYLCSFKMTIAEAFVNFLWQKVMSPNVAPVIRQDAVTYIGSILARAKYITRAVLKNTLFDMATWIRNYILKYDNLRTVPDTHAHLVFYSVCQSLFYIFVCRHEELVNSRKDLLFLQSLNLSNIITSCLNPLKVCSRRVIANFAAATQKYQLAYCYTVIEQNSRSSLPVIHTDEKGMAVFKADVFLGDFFPFDPFFLPIFSKYIVPIYQSYQLPDEEDQNLKDQKDSCETEDDFLSGVSSSPAMMVDPSF